MKSARNFLGKLSSTILISCTQSHLNIMTSRVRIPFSRTETRRRSFIPFTAYLKSGTYYWWILAKLFVRLFIYEWLIWWKILLSIRILEWNLAYAIFMFHALTFIKVIISVNAACHVLSILIHWPNIRILFYSILFYVTVLCSFNLFSYAFEYRRSLL